MTRRLVALLVVVLVGVTGCSSGKSADEWAGEVCAALGPWKSKIADLNDQGRRQMLSATSTTETLSYLDGLLGGAASASEAARVRVAAAGVPDVDGGAAVAASFVASLTGARDAYAQARADLKALPMSDDTQFYDGVVRIMSALNEQYESTAVDPATLNSPALKQAFEGSAACR